MKIKTTAGKHKLLWLIGGALLIGAAWLPINPANAQQNELRQVSGQLQPQANAPAASGIFAAPPAAASSLHAPVVEEQARQPAWLRSAESGAREINVPGLISQLAMSTMLVLCLCVAGLVVLKKLRNGTLATGIKSTATSSADLEVEATLKLGNGHLQIVRAADTRLVVASDASGIKSVQPIGSLFAQELQREEELASRHNDRPATGGRTEEESGRFPGFVNMRGIRGLHQLGPSGPAI